MPKGVDTPVIGGSLNGAGCLIQIITAIGTDTVLAAWWLWSIPRRLKAPVQQRSNGCRRFCSGNGLAVLTFVGWTAWGSWQNALINAVSVLVINVLLRWSSPTPTASGGTGVAAKNGILIKNAKPGKHGAGSDRRPRQDRYNHRGPSIRSGARRVRENPMIVRLIASAETGSEHPSLPSSPRLTTWG